MMHHRKKIAWFTGDVYCNACGRVQPWPCPHAVITERVLKAFKLYKKRRRS